ncbi:hypothetical protein [Natrialba swarupiae]|uniref:hypothetical protein n=1 Tax=Natrialba swarupiae TaxID=2448032 RepID=UPI001390A788|nr:hypothetical protein [Natrialba swarupiae]
MATSRPTGKRRWNSGDLEDDGEGAALARANGSGGRQAEPAGYQSASKRRMTRPGSSDG